MTAEKGFDELMNEIRQLADGEFPSKDLLKRIQSYCASNPQHCVLFGMLLVGLADWGPEGEVSEEELDRSWERFKLKMKEDGYPM